MRTDFNKYVSSSDTSPLFQTSKTKDRSKAVEINI